MDYDEAVEKGLITVMGAETDEKFLSNVMGQVNDKAAVEKVADTFKMVYTPSTAPATSSSLRPCAAWA